MTNRGWIVACGLFALISGASRTLAADVVPEKEVPAAQVRWSADGPGGVPGFARHIEPLLGKVGCNGRACHGSFQGQGGFRLSLFSSDLRMDHDALVKDGLVDLKDADSSLALEKATTKRSHKGGKRFEINSWQHRMFRDWIAAGAPYAPGDEPILERLQVVPPAIVLTKKGAAAQLKVLAHYSDQTVEDVTALTQFSTNDDVIAPVSEQGRITAGSSGDTAVVATFAGTVTTSHVIVPVPNASQIAMTDFVITNKIDELAAAKWNKLGLRPSELADDAEFLRRVYLDLIGTMPTADEARKFLADKDAHKRAKLIEQLLNRPEYALFWATKFSDLTGNDDRLTPQPRSKTCWLWYSWLQDKFEKNTPYDEIVEGIVTATTREGRKVEETVKEHEAVSQGISDRNFDLETYGQRKTCDIFWKKAGNRGEKAALQISYAFLGIRLECAQCHKHPFDRWTQEDFRNYTAFFTPVRVGVPPDVPKGVVPKTRDRRNYQYSEVYVQLTDPRRGGNNNNTNLRVRVLGGESYQVKAGQDPRVILMDWMRSPDNPFFAKAIVNRIWAHYFGVGIVDPPDDLNAANPPSNPELLDWLAQDFIEHKFDLKHLHRTILNARVYQLTWKPNETNTLDERNFSHALLRRISAEVVVDAVNQATGGQNNLSTNLAPPNTRAIGLAPTRLGNNGPGYALAIFGRPLRTQTCDCERSTDSGLPQAMYLINDSEVNAKISASNGKLAGLVKQIPDDTKLVEEIYLGTLSRFPKPEEMKKALDHVAAAKDRKAGFEDVLWSLMNVREFVFNH